MSLLAGASLESAVNTHALPPESVIFGQTAAMREVRLKLERVAGANLAVLITGESGTGKDIIARLLHLYSPWAEGPFVKVNCPAIPGSLLESELFGYEKGAFTGALGTKPGRVEMANRGTLFLDEISELDPALQAKLLQLLQDGQFSRIGSQEDTKVEVRVVSATNRELHRQMDHGNFRSDVFYRIAGMIIHLPALRERAVDIPLICEYLLQYYNDKLNGRAPSLRPALLAKMQRYSWPGNVRQLENLIKRYVVMGTDDAILSELLESDDRDVFPEVTFEGPVSLKKLTQQTVRKIEARIIVSALHANNWNRKKTARALGLSYRALLYKLKDVGIPQRRGSVSALRGEDEKPG
ncbi:MAG TPA: sigma-54 dependent transcriptional regulator [Candidatus Angelobacter sp.]|nr:sigma-54 dependent transcriptional regulator [Candidatus Angelobacter sp.]